MASNKKHSKVEEEEEEEETQEEGEEEEEEEGDDEEEGDEEEEEQPVAVPRRATGRYTQGQKMTFDKMAIAQTLANKGLGDDEIRGWLQALDDPETADDVGSYINNYLNEIKKVSEVVSAIPPEIRGEVGPIVTQQIVNGRNRRTSEDDDMEDDRWFKRFAKRMALVSSVVGGNSPELQKKLDGVTVQLQELKDEKKRNELDVYMNSILQRIDGVDKAVSEKVEMLEQKIGGGGGNNSDGRPKDAMDQILEEGEQTLAKVNKFRALMGQPPLKSLTDTGASPAITDEVEDAVIEKVLAKKGWKVEKPKTHEETMKMINEKLAEMEEKHKKDVEKVREDERRKISREDQLITVGTEILNLVGEFIPDKGQKAVSGLGDAIKKARGNSPAPTQQPARQQQPSTQTSKIVVRTDSQSQETAGK